MSTYPEFALRDGSVAPGVAFGVGTALHQKSCVAEVKSALKVGFKHFDLAEVYETTPYVGQALKEAGVDPKTLYITTKAGAGMKDVKKTLDQELKALGAESVDLYLLHWPHDFRKAEFPSMEQAWREMIEVKESGKAKSIGVSNFRVRDLQKLIESNPKELPVVNQIEFHPFLYAISEEVVRFCAEHDIKIEAYSPTAPITRFSGGPFDSALEKVSAALSERHGRKVEPSQVLLKLASQRDTIVVTTSTKEWRMKQQLEAGALPALTPEEIQFLTESATPAPQRAFEEHMGEPDVEY